MLLRRLTAAPRLTAAWALSLVSLSALAWSLRAAPRLEELEGFGEAAAHVAAAADATSFVVLWPPGQGAALALLPASVRAADAVPLEPAASRRYFRIVVLGPAGFAPPPELAQAEVHERLRFGDVEVGAFDWPRAERLLYDLRAALPRATVQLRGAGAELACDARRDDGGFDCPGRPEWNRVAPERLRVLGEDWPAVWAHPVAGRDLVIDLGPVRLGDRLALEAALADGAAGTPGGAAVQLELEIEGTPSRTLWRSNATGIARLDVPTARGREAAVRLIIRTSHDGRRHLGVNLRALESP